MSKKALAEVTTFISRGISPKYGDSGFVVVNQRCIRDNRIDFSNARFSSREKTRINANKCLRQWDGLVNSTGVGTLGRVAQVIRPADNATADSHVSIVRPDISLLDGRYFGYAMIGVEGYIETLGTGATGQTELSRTILSEVEISVHPLPTQRKIASILSAYDDLIENNLRRIKILEEMAQALYREWFVKFRFPGHEKTRMVDSPLGKVPEGWEVKPLRELTDVITKGTTPTTLGKPFTEEGVNFVKVESVDNHGAIREEKLAKIDTETHALLRRSQLAKDDILYSIAGAIGRVTLVPERVLPANTNQALAIIRSSDPLFVPYLYLNIRSLEFVNFSLGRVVQTAQANVSLSVLSAAPVAFPPGGLLQLLANTVGPMLGQIDCLLTKDSNLRRTRDLLLPKLISGELDVSDLDIKTGGPIQ